MRSLRVLSLFVFVMVVGVVAEAQCLRCVRQPEGPPTSGTCAEGAEGYCDRDCCGNVVGAPCRRPDAIDPCGWWLARGSAGSTPTVLRAAQRQQLPYFATRQPIERRTEELHRRLQKSGCGARV